MIDYSEKTKLFKALADANRLKIIDILTCGERCACEILGHFEFTQPTLSHHMKVLAEVDLVHIRKEGAWSHYALNMDTYREITEFLDDIFHESEDCICRVIDRCQSKEKVI